MSNIMGSTTTKPKLDDCIKALCIIDGEYYDVEYRYGSHPYRCGFNECLYIHNTPFKNYKFEVTKVKRVKIKDAYGNDFGYIMLTVILPRDDSLSCKEIMNLPEEKHQAKMYLTVKLI